MSTGNPPWVTMQLPAAWALAAAILLAAAAAAQSAGVGAASIAAAGTSKLWGRNGERWDLGGRLPEFSFAGYRQANAELPSPPVTRSVLDFRKPNKTDTDMLVAALAWAHKQTPPAGGYTVLFIPAGTYLLTEWLWIRKSNIVIRGAGAGKTILDIRKSLTDLYGKRKGYVNSGAFINIMGELVSKGKVASSATGSAAKGSYVITVKNPARVQVGRYYDSWWTDVGGKFNRAQFDNKRDAPSNFNGSTKTRWIVRVLAKNGNKITLERPLPFAISPSVVRVAFYEPPPSVTEAGIEGLTFKFKHELYAGHHLERGWSAVDITAARDCWVRDLEIINPDNGVMLNYLAASVTITGINIWYTKTRANNIPNPEHESADADGHWGLVYSVAQDALFTNYNIRGRMMHDVGTGMMGKFGVFMNGKHSTGDLDLHRGMAGPTLYTNIDVRNVRALGSGGPPRAGPNSVSYSTWWNIRSSVAMDPNFSGGAPPGSCNFSTSINLIGLRLTSKSKGMCSSWLYEPGVSQPANLYEAQLARRKSATRRGSQ